MYGIEHCGNITRAADLFILKSPEPCFKGRDSLLKLADVAL